MRALLITVLMAIPARAADKVQIDDASKRAIARGLEWLAAKQNADGSWSESRYPHNTAITSFALLAFMSQGHLPGQGQYGPGQTGPWPMMGPGMMGMMAVRIDHPSVQAGAVRFDVTNWSQGTVHNLFIVAVDNPQAPLPYDYSQAKVAMDQVKVMGGLPISSPVNLPRSIRA